MIKVEHRGGVLLPVHDLWLDPPDPRTSAFVSHAHSDHAGRHRETILTAATSELMRARLGPGGVELVMAYGEKHHWRGLDLTLLPAGHVRGSAQLLAESDEGSLLYTGDFKLRPGLSAEPVAWSPAETLVMETTFGRPEFVFPPTAEVIAGMVEFCLGVLDDGGVPVLLGYSLGKAQEILCALASAGLSCEVHPSVAKMTQICSRHGEALPSFAVCRHPSRTAGRVVLAPPHVRNSPWVRSIPHRRMAIATGWALKPGALARYQCDAAFALSDHAGYDDLLRYVELVRPRRVLTLHGFAADFARDLRARGVEAWALSEPDQLELHNFTVPELPGSERPAPLGPDHSPFGMFCQTAVAVAGTTARRAKVSQLAAYLRTLQPDDAARAAAWLSDRTLEGGQALQAGWAIIRRALAEVAGLPLPAAQALSRRWNDAGLTARDLLDRRPPGERHGVDLEQVEAFFQAIAQARGPVAKAALLRGWFAECRTAAGEMVVRILTGDLRIGLKEGLLEEALAEAWGAGASTVREAAMLLGEAGALARAAASGSLAEVQMQLHRPVRCMLAAVEPDGERVWQHMAGQAGFAGRVWVEDKYDGIRAQIHAGGDRVDIYSRDLRPITGQFPELAAAAAGLGRAVVLDGEILAVGNGRLLSFHDLQRRLNRREPDLFFQEEVPVEYAAFDVLWIDGHSLVRRPWSERKEVLAGLGWSGPLRLAEARAVTSADGIEEAFLAARARGHEGLVAKDPGAPYTPGRRGGAWVKLKKAGATLDVVVTAVEFGHGRRRDVLSDYTFAVRDAGGGLLTLGKAYTGLTDAEIAGLTPHFLARVTAVRGRVHHVRPEVVLEVAFDSIRPSPRHASGLALRFPRIKRVRSDKTVAEIDTLETARALVTVRSD